MLNYPNNDSHAPTAFVTGATGLLGNNLVRELIADGWSVRALVRSPEKATLQFAGLDLEIITGDMLDVRGFADALKGVDVVFHTAAYFRDSYKGGVIGTRSTPPISRVPVACSITLIEPACGASSIPARSLYCVVRRDRP